MISIDLSNQDAELFKKFRQYQDDFQSMLEAGIFNYRNGQATIHRDNEGKLRKIEVNELKFKI